MYSEKRVNEFLDAINAPSKGLSDKISQLEPFIDIIMDIPASEIKKWADNTQMSESEREIIEVLNAEASRLELECANLNLI